MGGSWLSVTEPLGRLSFAKELVNSASFIQKQCLGQECPSPRQLSLRAVLLSIALGSWFQRCKILWGIIRLHWKLCDSRVFWSCQYQRSPVWVVCFVFAWFCFLTSTTPFMISEAVDTKQLFRIHKHQGDPLLQWLEHQGDENITRKAESIAHKPNVDFWELWLNL